MWRKRKHHGIGKTLTWIGFARKLPARTVLREEAFASGQRTLWKDATLTCPVLTSTRSSSKTANRWLHQSFAWLRQFDMLLNIEFAQMLHATPATYFLEVQ